MILSYDLQKLWKHITKKRRSQIIVTLTIMIIASVSEVISIGAIIPFLAILVQPERIFDISYLKNFTIDAGISTPASLKLPLTIFFVASALVAAGMRLLLLWRQTKLCHRIGSDISQKIFFNILYQPYSEHINNNSSEVIVAISGKTDAVIYNTILSLLMLCSTTVIITSISIMLIFINPLVAAISMGGIGFIYFLIIKFTKKKLINESNIISSQSVKNIKITQEALGGIRDVIIDGTQSIYRRLYRESDNPMRAAQANIAMISGAPRFLIESIGVSIIAIFAYNLSLSNDGVLSAVPLLGAIALAAQRLLPAIQLFFSCISGIRGSQSSLADVIKLLDQEPPIYLLENEVGSSLIFKESISLNNIVFRYKGSNTNILDGVSLSIRKGNKIGIVGSTGSGKSTLIDILMGLLNPTNGKLLIDGQCINDSSINSWQKNIAHVPQSIFLTDSTIRENIAFGKEQEKINIDEVQKAAEKACIASTIESLDLKYETEIGERGVRLSGGQRQRIGIARALYKKAQLIILDEATRALDDKTEENVMSAISSLDEDITILIVAHRLTTLKYCDRIFEIKNGKIMEFNSIEEFKIK